MPKQILIVFIGEWWTEKSFFEELMKHEFWFKFSNDKFPNLLCKHNIAILIAHPTNWWNNSWDSVLVSAPPYMVIKWKIKQCRFQYDEVYYVILTDESQVKSKEKNIPGHIKNYCPHWNIHICFASKEIETWFLAGIWEKFKHQHPVNKSILVKKFKWTIDEILNTKELLDSILDKPLSTNRNEIWRQFWKYIDIDQASRSRSFINFLNTIKSIIAK